MRAHGHSHDRFRGQASVTVTRRTLRNSWQFAVIARCPFSDCEAGGACAIGHICATSARRSGEALEVRDCFRVSLALTVSLLGKPEILDPTPGCLPLRHATLGPITGGAPLDVSRRLQVQVPHLIDPSRACRNTVDKLACLKGVWLRECALQRAAKVACSPCMASQWPMSGTLECRGAMVRWTSNDIVVLVKRLPQPSSMMPVDAMPSSHP